MKQTGDILRKAREQKGLSLGEIALSLKISPKILTAIENGDEAQLPAKTFLRGFVQSYAAFLRLDVDQVMNTFYAEVGSTKPKPLIRAGDSTKAEADSNSPKQDISDEQRAQQDHLAPINEKSNTKAIIVATIGAILIGLILFTKKMIDKYSKEAEVDSSISISAPLENPTPTITPVQNVAPGEAAATSTTGSAAAPAVSTAPAATQPAITPAPSPAAIVSPSPAAAKVVATPLPTLTPSVPVVAVAPSPSISPTPGATPEKPALKSVELIIEALDNVELEYSSNTGKTSTLRLSAEQVHTFKSKNGLKLKISNGGAVNLILNGRDLGIPGDLGKTINLSY